MANTKNVIDTQHPTRKIKKIKNSDKGGIRSGIYERRGTPPPRRAALAGGVPCVAPARTA